MVEPLRHRQTKGVGTDMLSLTSPRHISTLPTQVFGRNARIAAIARRKGEPWCNLDYRSQRQQTWACKKIQVSLSRGDGHSQFARTAMALGAGRPRKGIT
jgi:hypothetical protein